MTDWMMNQAAECDPDWPSNATEQAKRLAEALAARRRREETTMSNAPRFFLAHAKSCNDDEIERLVKVCSVLLDRFAKGGPFDLVTGRAYFEARFKECGSWEAWTAEVAAGVNYLTRKPTFTAILVPAGPIGAGTKRIVEQAIGASRPVFAFREREGETLSPLWAPVAFVKTVDPKDWATGYRLVCSCPLHE